RCLSCSAPRDAFRPGAVLQVPLHGLAQAALETLARSPAKLARNLGRVHGVASVVTRSVGHEADERRVRAARARIKLVQQRANRLHEVDVLLLRTTSNLLALDHR